MYNLELTEQEVKNLGQDRWLRKYTKLYFIAVAVWVLLGIIPLLIDNDYGVATLIWALLGISIIAHMILKMNSAGKRYMNYIKLEQYRFLYKGVEIGNELSDE